MSALEKYSKEKNEKIYVVSDDKDLKDFCALHKRLIAVNSLDKLLDIYNSHESTLSELVKQFITENISLLKERIKEVLAYSDAVDEAAGEDSEVEDFSVQVIESYEPTVISIDEKHAVATFDFDADIEVTVTGPDRNGGYYDREEGRVFPFGDTRRHYTDTRTFTAEIKLIYGYSDGKLKNCMITGVTLAGSYRKTMARARGTLGFSSP